jgi:hypothetical protein
VTQEAESRHRHSSAFIDDDLDPAQHRDNRKSSVSSRFNPSQVEFARADQRDCGLVGPSRGKRSAASRGVVGFRGVMLGVVRVRVGPDGRQCRAWR